MSSEFLSSLSRKKAIRLGFVSLVDAAPLIAAKELGLFETAELNVTLNKEVGWATIRDKMLTGELHATHATAHMLWGARLGLGGPSFPACTALLLNLHGNALCLSNRLRVWGVHDAASLRTEALRRRGERKLVFGVVYPFSSHNLHLRAWLASAGLVPDRDVRIAVVPPAQMLATLSAGTIDGFMAGEPWPSLAVASGLGWAPLWSGALFPGHLEKVLLTRDELAGSDEQLTLVRCIAQAAQWCDIPANRPALAEMLSAPRYLNQPADILGHSLCGNYDFGHGRKERLPDFHIFSEGNAGTPTREKALVVQRDLLSAGLVPHGLPESLPDKLFRNDLHKKALSCGKLTAVLSR